MRWRCIVSVFGQKPKKPIKPSDQLKRTTQKVDRRSPEGHYFYFLGTW